MQEEYAVTCPFCWETLTLLIDGSVDDQTYVEDCHVCCQPMEVHCVCSNGEVISVDVQAS